MTDNEKAAYLRGRRDKAREVIQDIYCNHGGSSHPVYDFFQDSEIGYEEIVGWKLEAKRFCEQKVIEKYGKRHCAPSFAHWHGFVSCSCKHKRMVRLRFVRLFS